MHTRPSPLPRLLLILQKKLDRSHFSSEISLIHFGNLQQRAFSSKKQLFQNALKNHSRRQHFALSACVLYLQSLAAPL